MGVVRGKDFKRERHTRACAAQPCARCSVLRVSRQAPPRHRACMRLPTLAHPLPSPPPRAGEMTKAKRSGRYTGGAIDPNATFSIKFESDEE